MSSGIEVFSPNGDVILDTTKNVWSFVGSVEIPKKTAYTYTIPPALVNMDLELRMIRANDGAFDVNDPGILKDLNEANATIHQLWQDYVPYCRSLIANSAIYSVAKSFNSNYRPNNMAATVASAQNAVNTRLSNLDTTLTPRFQADMLWYKNAYSLVEPADNATSVLEKILKAAVLQGKSNKNLAAALSTLAYIGYTGVNGLYNLPSAWGNPLTYHQDVYDNTFYSTGGLYSQLLNSQRSITSANSSLQNTLAWVTANSNSCITNGGPYDCAAMLASARKSVSDAVAWYYVVAQYAEIYQGQFRKARLEADIKLQQLLDEALYAAYYDLYLVIGLHLTALGDRRLFQMLTLPILPDGSDFTIKTPSFQFIARTYQDLMYTILNYQVPVPSYSHALPDLPFPDSQRGVGWDPMTSGVNSLTVTPAHIVGQIFDLGYPRSRVNGLKDVLYGGLAAPLHYTISNFDLVDRRTTSGSSSPLWDRLRMYLDNNNYSMLRREAIENFKSIKTILTDYNNFCQYYQNNMVYFRNSVAPAPARDPLYLPNGYSSLFVAYNLKVVETREYYSKLRTEILNMVSPTTVDEIADALASPETQIPTTAMDQFVADTDAANASKDAMLADINAQMTARLDELSAEFSAAVLALPARSPGDTPVIIADAEALTTTITNTYNAAISLTYRVERYPRLYTKDYIMQAIYDYHAWMQTVVDMVREQIDAMFTELEREFGAMQQSVKKFLDERKARTKFTNGTFITELNPPSFTVGATSIDFAADGDVGVNVEVFVK